MQRDTLAPLVIGGLVAAAIAAGLWVTGGPTSARAEKRDLSRLEDLRRLSEFINCVAQETKEVPEMLAPMDSCGTDQPFLDRTSNAPYRFEKLSDKSFRLCADFERPDLVADDDIADGSLDRASGCIRMNLR